MPQSPPTTPIGTGHRNAAKPARAIRAGCADAQPERRRSPFPGLHPPHIHTPRAGEFMPVHRPAGNRRRTVRIALAGTAAGALTLGGGVALLSSNVGAVDLT